MNRFMKAIAAIMLSLAVVCAACTKDPENGGGNNSGGSGGGSGSGGGNNGGGNSGGGTTEGVYLGVIGFNDDLITKTIGMLNANSESSYTNFINTLSMRDGTVLYHADNTALDWLQNATLPGQLFNVSLITFTDGLDNGSTMLNSNYNSPSDYLNAVSNRIRNDRVGGNAITAYSIGLKGNDVTDNTSFQQNLQKLSSSPSNYFEVANWEEAKQRFRQIAIQLYNETTTINAEVKIPGGKADGTVIRITFDNVSNANTSSQYIQGTYYRENGKGKLKNVTYQGLQSSSGTEVVSARQDGIFYWYSFAGLKLPNGNPFTNTSNMSMWYNLNSSDWQPESEFTPEAYSDINVNRKSAVAILVLDCSSSLGSDFGNMKDAAKEFVQLLNDYGNSGNGGGTGGGGNGGGNGSGNTPTGAISGVFSVSASQCVYFSQGNLQYKASNGTWCFAPNQYEYIGHANSNISSSYSGWIDLFGWGTSGWNCGNTYYRPWDSDNSDASLYGPPGQYNLTGSYANSDWGRYNAISNGGNTSNTWRTLTKEEWAYVFNTRSTNSGIRYAKAQVNGVNGVILLPDDWSGSYYTMNNTNQSGASFSSNVISSSTWTNSLEAHGAVFLPAAGYRDGSSVLNVGSYGFYWSASSTDISGASGVYFNDGPLYIDFDLNRRCGFSVRLVCSSQ